MSNIAVYGTLMRPFKIQEELEISDKLHYIGDARIPGALYDLGDFPGLVKSGEEYSFAEVFEVNDEKAMHIMDLYEDFYPEHPKKSMYIRELVDLEGYDEPCWVYYYTGLTNGRKKIKENNWIEYFTQKYGMRPEEI